MFFPIYFTNIASDYCGEHTGEPGLLLRLIHIEPFQEVFLVSIILPSSHNLIEKDLYDTQPYLQYTSKQ